MTEAAPSRGTLRAVTVLAWTNIVLHALALALSLEGIRPGTPAFSPDERMIYLARAPLLWELAWGAWMASALALVTFLELLGRSLRGRESNARLAVSLAVAGVAIDLTCDATQMLVLPSICSREPRDPALFLAFARFADVGGFVAANGLYSLAVLVLSFSLKESKAALLLGAATGVFGFLLAAAGFTGEARCTELAAGPTMLFFMAWTLAAARASARASEGP
ncbi:hypothetical protein HY251_13290 [bacterium]|nr:hypothetical protein [bacterium]